MIGIQEETLDNLLDNLLEYNKLLKIENDRLENEVRRLNERISQIHFEVKADDYHQ